MTFNNNGTCNYYYDYLKYSKNFDKLYPGMERFISEVWKGLYMNRLRKLKHINKIRIKFGLKRRRELMLLIWYKS